MATGNCNNTSILLCCVTYSSCPSRQTSITTSTLSKPIHGIFISAWSFCIFLPMSFAFHDILCCLHLKALLLLFWSNCWFLCWWELYGFALEGVDFKTVKAYLWKPEKFWSDHRQGLFFTALFSHCSHIYIYQSHPKELWIVELRWVVELITARICYPLWALALTAIHCLQHWLCEIKSSYRDLPGTFAVWRVHSWKSFTPNEPRLSRYNSSTRKCRPEENRKNGTSFLAVLHALFV